MCPGDLHINGAFFAYFDLHSKYISLITMEEGQEGVREAVLEELLRLGVQDIVNRDTGGKKTQHGGRFLPVSLHHYSTSSSKTGKGKQKGKRSPSRSVMAKSPLKVRDDRKYTPKSPFSNAKRRAEVRRLNNANKENKVRVCV